MGPLLGSSIHPITSYKKRRSHPSQNTGAWFLSSTPRWGKKKKSCAQKKRCGPKKKTSLGGLFRCQAGEKADRTTPTFPPPFFAWRATAACVFFY